MSQTLPDSRVPPGLPDDDQTAPTNASLEEWLVQAHLPSLLAALAYRTGDLSVLDSRFQPQLGAGAFRVESPSGVAPEARDEAIALAAGLIRNLSEMSEPEHSDERLRSIMEFLTGPLDADYLPLLKHELALPHDSGKPDWTQADIAPGREFSVVVVGAGMSGLAAAHRLRQAGIRVTVLERRPDLGGVWFDNDYPGAKLDTSNFNYSYSFSQHGQWKDQFSSRDSVLEYLHSLADQFALRDVIEFGQTVTAGRFDAEAGTWTLSVEDSNTGSVRTVVANAMISAVGQLNEPQIPEIPGIDTFSGPMWHTARWRHDVQLEGKRIGVVGTGASAFQVIPPIAETAEHLSVFQRTPAWVLPTPGYNEPLASGFRRLLSTVPHYYRFYRFTQFWRNVEGLRGFAAVDPEWEHPVSVSAANETVRAALERSLRQVFSNRSDLIEKLLPTYPPYAKRSVRDDGTWSNALQRDNVTVVTDPIAQIVPEGIVLGNGDRVELDIIVLGTGFKASDFLASLPLTGLNGVPLDEYWGGDARAMYGVTIPGFPNLFCLYGPNTNVNTNGSVVLFVELALEYAMACLKELLSRDAKAMVLREQVLEDFYIRLDAAAKGLAVGHSTVNSWYKNRLAGSRRTGPCQPWSIGEAREGQGMTMTISSRPWTERVVQAGSFRTRVLEAGRADADPVLLLHDGAWGGSASSSWSELIPLLAKDFRVIAPDLIGFGESDKAVFLDQAPVESRIDHVRSILGVLIEDRPVHVVGCSFGGALGLRAITRSSPPFAVRSMTSICGAGGAASRTEVAIRELGQWDGTRDDLARVLRLLIDERFAGFERLLDERFRCASIPGHYRAVMAATLPLPAALKQEHTDDWPSPLRLTAPPLQLIRGRDDVLLAEDWADQIRRYRPDAAIRVLESRHAPQIDHADEVHKLLSGFFATHQ